MRRFRSKREASATGPSTVVGVWLRALLLDQRELTRQLNTTLNYGKPGWNDDEPAVAGGDVRDGGPGVFRRRLRRPGDYVVRLREILLGWHEATVDRRIVEAERVAFERGWNPPPAA